MDGKEQTPFRNPRCCHLIVLPDGFRFPKLGACTVVSSGQDKGMKAPAALSFVVLTAVMQFCLSIQSLSCNYIKSVTSYSPPYLYIMSGLLV